MTDNTVAAVIDELRGQTEASAIWAREDYGDETDVRRAEYIGEARAYRDAARVVAEALYPPTMNKAAR